MNFDNQATLQNVNLRGGQFQLALSRQQIKIDEIQMIQNEKLEYRFYYTLNNQRKSYDLFFGEMELSFTKNNRRWIQLFKHIQYLCCNNEEIKNIVKYLIPYFINLKQITLNSQEDKQIFFTLSPKITFVKYSSLPTITKQTIQQFYQLFQTIIQQSQSYSKTINLQNSNLKDQSFKFIINHLKNILCLRLSNNYLTIKSIKLMQIYVSNLQYLDLNGNSIHFQSFSKLSQMLSKLTTLKLAFTNITQNCLQIICQKLKICQNFDISYNQINYGKIIPQLCKLKKLKRLAAWTGGIERPYRYYEYTDLNIHFLNKNYKMRGQFILNQQEKQIKLLQLVINWPDDISKLIQTLSDKCQCLEIKGVINDDSIQNIQKMKHLERIFLLDPENKIRKISSKKLKSLTVARSSFSKFDDELQFLQKDNLILRSLNLMNHDINKKITIICSFKNLSSLNLKCCQLNQQAVKQITNNLFQLDWLNLSQNRISFSSIEILLKKLKKLKTLFINNCGNYENNTLGEEYDNLIRLSSQKIIQKIILQDLYIKVQQIQKSYNYIDDNYLTCEGALYICKLKELVYADLRSNKIYNGLQIMKLADKLPQYLKINSEFDWKYEKMKMQIRKLYLYI